MPDDAYEMYKVNDYVVRYTLMMESTELFELHRLGQCCPDNDNSGNLESVNMNEKDDFMQSPVQNPTKGYKISGR